MKIRIIKTLNKILEIINRVCQPRQKYTITELNEELKELKNNITRRNKK